MSSEGLEVMLIGVLCLRRGGPGSALLAVGRGLLGIEHVAHRRLVLDAEVGGDELALVSPSSSAIRSRTPSLDMRNSAEVPGVTFSRTVSMKSSLMPKSRIDPESAPIAAPNAIPKRGTKKMMPKSRPQNAPPEAPAAVGENACWVLGFFLPSGHETTTASWTLMSCFF
ncbi:hypothetical protein AVL62_10000 [Serinicoccus chungangensis]|uniref:Uncharacterized protein n=1 Tax=Serinicoccus chungangensis TaxID=767452 RepID=A0A0W8I276_9MICO|nr:hypothetical protein AVL62_10000 [Serinicoccus chungangensis]